MKTNPEIHFTKIEKKHLFISILVVSFVFGFNDKRPFFQLIPWLFNFIKIAILVTISILCYIYAQKYWAIKYGSTSEYELWTITRYGFKARQKLPFSINIGIFLPLVITLLSLGKIFFPLTNMSHITYKKTPRLGRRWAHLPEYEEGRISLMGPLANTALVLIFKILSPLIPTIAPDAILINTYLIIFHMLPLPQTDGGKLFFGERTFYILSLAFIIACLSLIHITNILTTIIVAAILSIIAALIYFYILEYKYRKLKL